MKSKNYFIVSIIIFILAGALHLVRSLMGLELKIGSFIVPSSVSWILVIILAYMIWQGFKILKE